MDIDSACEHIEFLEDCKRRHIQWADYFEKYPDKEAEYCGTGDWEGAEAHRELAGKYSTLIAFIEELQSENQRVEEQWRMACEVWKERTAMKRC